MKYFTFGTISGPAAHGHHDHGKSALYRCCRVAPIKEHRKGYSSSIQQRVSNLLWLPPTFSFISATLAVLLLAPKIKKKCLSKFVQILISIIHFNKNVRITNSKITTNCSHTNIYSINTNLPSCVFPCSSFSYIFLRHLSQHHSSQRI